MAFINKETSEKKGFFAMVPSVALKDRRISANAKLILGEIYSLSDEDGCCFPSNKHFSKLLGISETQVSVHISRLFELKYIVCIYETDNSRSIFLDMSPIQENLKTSLRKLKDPSLRKLKQSNTYTSNTVINTNVLIGDKSPKYGKETNFQNPHVYQILKDFSEVTGLISPADKQAPRVAWNFHQKYGAKNFRPALVYLQGLWKNVDITKIETVKLHYPTYQKDVLKVSAIKLTKEQEEIAELYASRN